MADPMYRQIAEDLRRKIESGELSPGDRLPTEPELQDLYQRASRNTVRDAIKELAQRGLVRKRPGRGTFVVEPVVPLVVDLTPALDRRVPELENVEHVSDYLSTLSSASRRRSSSEPRVQVHVAHDRIAENLRIAPGSQAVSRHQEKYVDGVPFSLQTTFYPYRYVEQGGARLLEARTIREGAVPYLQKLLGFQEVGYEDRLSVRPSHDLETYFFRLENHVLVVETGRISFDAAGTPVRYTITVYPSDRNQFIIRAGDVPAVNE